jgi:hypothetical protein
LSQPILSQLLAESAQGFTHVRLASVRIKQGDISIGFVLLEEPAEELPVAQFLDQFAAHRRAAIETVGIPLGNACAATPTVFGRRKVGIDSNLPARLLGFLDALAPALVPVFQDLILPIRQVAVGFPVFELEQHEVESLEQVLHEMSPLAGE